MNKKNIALLGLLILLVVIFKLSQKKEKIEEQIAFFKADSTTIASFKIYDKKDTLKIEKQGEKWQMVEPVNFPANTQKVKELINLISTVRTSNIPVAESKESLKKYNSLDSLGTSLILYDKNGKEIEHDIISRGKDYNKTFARNIKNTKVFLLDKVISYQIKTDSGIWRDPIIFEYPKDKIDQVEVSYKLNQYKLVNADTTWKYIDTDHNFNIPEKNVNYMKLFNRLKKTSTHIFVDNQFDKYKEFFDNPDLSVKIKLKNGVVESFKVAKVAENKFLLMKGTETKTLYDLPASYIDRFTIDPNHFQSN